MNIFLIILTSYIAHIFLCRQINVWMMNNKHHKPHEDYYMAIGAWFVPVLGLLYVAIFAIDLWAYAAKWKENAIWKWFAEGEEFKFKKDE